MGLACLATPPEGDSMRCIVLLILFMSGLVWSANPYVVRSFPDDKGNIINEVIVPGIPEELRNPGPIASPSRNAVVLTDVPKLDWCYGCSATSAAMIAGYYDRNGYENMYAGPTNGGMFPLNNASWGEGECSLSATHQGYDGLSSFGHVDRFWVTSGNSGNDPYGSADPTGTYANCTTDYMGTNQDWWSNEDGSTRFYYYTNGNPIYDYSGSENESPRKRDGIHGFRLFMESRGYEVSTNYNQYIHGYNGNTAGYTLAQFRQSIDNDIPVLIHVTGHTMVGVGYESTNNTIYIHNTWDHDLHSMDWGGLYSGMQHKGVSVFELAPAPVIAVIDWMPSLINLELDIDESSSQNLTIANTGTGALDYVCSVPGTESTILEEGFNSGVIPGTWTQTVVSGTTVNWECTSGGYSGYPSGPYEGNYNIRLYKGSYDVSVVKLISPPLNLQEADSASLDFWHTQDDWGVDQDELRVYYRNGSAGSWNLLQQYTDNVSAWTQRNISLPNLSDDYYVAFEGTTQYGYGVCLDQIRLVADSSVEPWLRLNGGLECSGTVAAGAADHNISVQIDATGLVPGTFSKNITILSNSQSDSEISIPVNLTVLEALVAPQEPVIEYLSGTNSARISWVAVSGNPSGYRVYFSTEPSFSDGGTLIATTASDRLYYVHTQASSRPKGFYRVIAFRN